MPLCYKYKTLIGKDILCESLFGPSLQKIYEVTKSEFDITTLSIIGIQVINILEKIHDKNIIHTNIKPTIICLGKFIKRNFTEKKLFYLIDFGYSSELFDTHDN